MEVEEIKNRIEKLESFMKTLGNNFHELGEKERAQKKIDGFKKLINRIEE